MVGRLGKVRLGTVTYDYCRVNRGQEEEEEEDPKSCSKSAQNRVCCSLGYGIRYIGTPNF